MQKPNGKIIDSISYEVLKKESEEKLSANINKTIYKIYTKENFTPVRKSSDSIILAYSWDFQILKKDAPIPEPTKLEKLKSTGFSITALDKALVSNIDMSAFLGKPTLINFWFIACKPCVDEMPVLNTLQKKLGEKVNFVAVTFEKKEDVTNFLKQHPFTFSQVTDAADFIDFLEIKSFPKNIFLDSKGVIQYIESGIPYTFSGKEKMSMGNGEEFIKKLRSLQ